MSCRNCRRSTTPASTVASRRCQYSRPERRRRSSVASRGSLRSFIASRPSPVAGRAVDPRMDVVALDELAAEGVLVDRRPGEVEDVLALADVRCGVTVAVEAPFHLQRRRLPDLIHLVDPAVAADAPDAL